MPSVSAKQARFMSACAHGWGADICPPAMVAKRFHEADKAEGRFICKDGCMRGKLVEARKARAALDGAQPIVFDEATGLMARLKLNGELAQIKAKLETAALIERMRLNKRMAEIRTLLVGGAPPATPPAGTTGTWRAKFYVSKMDDSGLYRVHSNKNTNPISPSFATEAEAEDWAVKFYRGAEDQTPEPPPSVEPDQPVVLPPEEQGPLAPRNPSAQFYDFDPQRKPAQRKKDNAAAMAILAKIDAGELDPATLDDQAKQALAMYSGTGAALIGADGKKGSAYEYYTPKPIAEGVWGLIGELAFTRGHGLGPRGGRPPLRC